MARTFGPAFIADAEPLNYIMFTDPRDGVTPVTGMVASMETLSINRSSARMFTIRGIDHVFRVSASYHVNIVA